MKHFTKKRNIYIVVSVLLIALSVYGLLNLNTVRTIYSLTKVDEYPLYYMKYYGDYHPDYRAKNSGDNTADTAVTSDKFGMLCSSFFATNNKGEPLFCRNLDYTLLRHQITVLKTDAPGKYASLTMADLFYLGYNESNPPVRSLTKGGNLMAAPRVTIDGVNEYGLSLAILSVPYAKPPYDPEKLTTDEVGINRLILDNAKTVAEAVEVMKQYNIKFQEGPAHFMIADANGDSAVIEFLDGEIVALWREEAWQVCTNFILSADLQDNEGKDRYDIAEQTLKEKNGILTEEEAMDLLGAISQNSTVWSVVYNLKTGEADIVMGKKYDQVHTFDLKMYNE